MADERIKSFVSPGAFEELRNAADLMKRCSDPVARLKMLCEAVARAYEIGGDNAGMRWEISTRNNYEAFVNAAIDKAKELL